MNIRLLTAIAIVLSASLALQLGCSSDNSGMQEQVKGEPFFRFNGYTVRNLTGKNIDASTVSGSTRTGPIFIAPGAGKTQGFGPIKLENPLSIVVLFDEKEEVAFPFSPDIGSIRETGKSVTLVFLIMSKTSALMAYDISRESPSRDLRIIVGEDPAHSAQRNLNEDLVHFSGWGTLDQIKLAINGGANIDSTNDFGMSALMMAVSNRKPDMVRYLLTHKPSLSLVNRHGESALDLAGYNQEMLSLLRR